MEVRNFSIWVDPTKKNHRVHLLLHAGTGGWQRSCCGAGMGKGIRTVKWRGSKAGAYCTALLCRGWTGTGWWCLKPPQNPSAGGGMKEIKSLPKQAFSPNAVKENAKTKSTGVEKKKKEGCYGCCLTVMVNSVLDDHRLSLGF